MSARCFGVVKTRLAASLVSTLNWWTSANCLEVMRWPLSVCEKPCLTAMARAAALSVAPPALRAICVRSGAKRCVAIRRLSWRACGGAGRLVELRAHMSSSLSPHIRRLRRYAVRGERSRQICTVKPRNGSVRFAVLTRGRLRHPPQKSPIPVISVSSHCEHGFTHIRPMAARWRTPGFNFNCSIGRPRRLGRLVTVTSHMTRA